MLLSFSSFISFFSFCLPISLFLTYFFPSPSFLFLAQLNWVTCLKQLRSDPRHRSTGFCCSPQGRGKYHVCDPYHCPGFRRGTLLYSMMWARFIGLFPYLQFCRWGQRCLAGWHPAWGFTAVVSWAFVWIMKCVFLTAFWGWCLFPHFSDEEQVTLSPESPRKFTQELGSKLSQSLDPMLLITTHCSGLCSGAPPPQPPDRSCLARSPQSLSLCSQWPFYSNWLGYRLIVFSLSFHHEW